MKTDEAEKQLFAALGRVPSGLFILTARHDDLETGMLASWVQQCSFEPPQVTVAVRRGRDVLSWLGDGATFILNILDESQTDMIAHFGRGFSLGEPAFTGIEIDHPHARSAPVLTEAHAYLECRILGRALTGDHELLIAQVIAGQRLNEGEPLVHVRKSGSHY